MNAKSSDIARIQEIFDIVVHTKRQIKALGIDEQLFVNPLSDEDELISEGILNRVLRATEEAGHLSDEITEKYGFDRNAMLGVRNRLAHVYGEIDRTIIWAVLEKDFDALEDACLRYCDDEGLELSAG